MSIADYVVLNVPGYTNSGPSHWQTLWERSDPTHFRRVEQADWEHPDPEQWCDALVAAVARAPEPRILLVGHSLGAVTIARAARTIHDRRVGGALLVAPCDVDRPDALAPLVPFAPMPRDPLPWPAILVASTDDPYLSVDRARDLAHSWTARLEVMEAAGHINTASGHGPFAVGERWLNELAGAALKDVNP